MTTRIIYHFKFSQALKPFVGFRGSSLVAVEGSSPSSAFSNKNKIYYACRKEVKKMDRGLWGEALRNSEETRTLLMQQLRLLSEESESESISLEELCLVSRTMCKLADKIQKYLR